MTTLTDLLGTSFAIVYPGQGSQVVGMGDDLLATSEAARDLYAAADRIVDAPQPLSQIMHEGPDDVLADTWNAQPALLTHSIAAWQATETLLTPAGLRPSMTAGHSLGEFTALVTADVLDFATALTLVRERGRLMKEAGEKRPGGMAAILGLDDDILEEVCAEASAEGIINLANANCPGQTVISGEVVALEKAMELAKAAGAKRAARLNVSIASHSPLMAEVSAELNRLLDDIDLRTPQIPVIANTTGQPLTTVDEVRAELRHHVELPVQWTTSVRTMIDDGVQVFVELGAGAVLAGLIKRIDRGVKTVSLADLRAAASE